MTESTRIEISLMKEMFERDGELSKIKILRLFEIVDKAEELLDKVYDLCEKTITYEENEIRNGHESFDHLRIIGRMCAVQNLIRKEL